MADSIKQEFKAFNTVSPHPSLPGVFLPNYEEEYKTMYAVAYGSQLDKLSQAQARRALNATLGKIINIIRPTQDLYMKYLMEEEVLDGNTIPSYFLRERTATDVYYLNYHDDSMLRTRVEPGEEFSVPPRPFSETAQWSRFANFGDLRPRDEALAQLKLTMDVARSKHWWTLAKASVVSAAATQRVQTTGTLTIAQFRSLLAVFTDAGYGDMLTQVRVIMNSESYEQLYNDCVSNKFPFSELTQLVAGIHQVPPIASAKNQYSMHIPTFTSGDDGKARIYAFLPVDHSKEFITKTQGVPMLYEDYDPNSAGWEAGVKVIARISTVIVDRKKAAYLDRTA